MNNYLCSLWILGILFLFASNLHAQPRDPLTVVQAQLDAYNAQDIEAFSALFAEDVEVYINIGDSLPGMIGRTELKARYGAMFKENPTNRSTLTGRMLQGNFVIDHEYISGRGNPFSIIAIYEVHDGLIVRCWFVR